jgi:hypothetical protein
MQHQQPATSNHLWKLIEKSVISLPVVELGFLESSFACGHVLGLGFGFFRMWLQLDLNFEIGEFEVCALLQIM